MPDLSSRPLPGPPRALRKPGPHWGQTQSYFCKDTSSVALGGHWPTMGHSPAPVEQGRPGSGAPGSSPLADAGWLLGRPPQPFTGRLARAHSRVCNAARVIPVASPGATCSSCSVMGRRADLGPPLLPPRALSFVQMTRGFPKCRGAIRNLVCQPPGGVAPSHGCHHAADTHAPGSGGQAKARGGPPSCAKPGMHRLGSHHGSTVHT